MAGAGGRVDDVHGPEGLRHHQVSQLQHLLQYAHPPHHHHCLHPLNPIPTPNSIPKSTG
jgi:hypothetical protein